MAVVERQMGGRKKDGNGRINIDFITENESQSLFLIETI